MINQDMKEFETWYIENWHDGDIHPNQSLLNLSPYDADEYIDQGVQNMWEAWQQAKGGNSKWIKCSDRLPVLADASDTFEVFIFNGTWVARYAYDFVKYVPAFTHWMPIPKHKLPEPPRDIL